MGKKHSEFQLFLCPFTESLDVMFVEHQWYQELNDKRKRKNAIAQHQSLSSVSN